MIFLAYANDPLHPLPSLSREEDGVFEILSRRYALKHFGLQRESHATIPKIAQYLIRFRDELEVFCYSGHAGGERLLLEGQEANAGGIAQLLQECPRLKLVLLNGCSTEGQVARLLTLQNQPAVIATSASVGDQEACQFAISFFQAMADEYLPVNEAFQIGLAAAQLAAKAPLQVEDKRQLAFQEATDRPLWGLFSDPDTPATEQWMLPLGLPAQSGPATVSPNEQLIQVLMQSLKPYEPEVAQIELEEQQKNNDFYFTETADTLLPKKHWVIFKSFPSPISSHLKMLFAMRRANTTREDFYDAFNLFGMRRLVQVYLSAAELPAFFLLGELWDLLLSGKGPEPPEELLPIIKRFLLARAEERRTQLQFQLVPAVHAFLSSSHRPPFFPELDERMADFAVDSDYYHACQTLESIHKRLAARQFRSSDDPQVAPTCLVAEKSVAEILRVQSFLANYSLVSVRNIDVLCNRQHLEPLFLHKLVRLEINLLSQDADPIQDVENMKAYLHNYSILVRPRGKAKAADQFLNLTPFIFDENAFILKSQAVKGNLKLFYFDHYDGLRDTLQFKQVDNFANPLLTASPQAAGGPNPLQYMQRQIEVFTQLLFNRPLREL